MTIFIEEDSSIILRKAVFMLHHCELLLLLIELHSIWIILKEFWMLLKKQLFICKLLGLLYIRSWLKNRISLVSASTFICEVSLVPVVLPATNNNIVFFACIINLLLYLGSILRLFFSIMLLESISNNTRDSGTVLAFV